MTIFLDIVKFVLLIFASFFTCQIITNKNKRISYIGTLLICFSTAVLEYINNGLVEAIFFCELIFISIDKLLLKEKFRYLYAFLIFFGIIGFLLLSNISFQISIGISMITLIIWRFLKFFKDEKERKENLKKLKKKEKNKEENGEENKKENNKKNKEKNKKENIEKKDVKFIVILSLGILVSIIVGIVFYKYNPIKSINNYRGINYLTNYTYDVFVKDEGYLHTFISVFPIGLFIGIYYIFKEENKHFNFYSITSLVSILELIILLLNIKFSFLPNYIFALSFNLLQIFMIIYTFANLDERYFGLVKTAYITLILLVILALMPRLKKLNATLLDISYIIFVLESYIVLNYSDKRFWRLGSWVFTIICISESIGYLIVKFM